MCFPYATTDICKVHLRFDEDHLYGWVVRHEFGHVMDFYYKWQLLRRCPSLLRHHLYGISNVRPNPQLERMADRYAAPLKWKVGA